MTSFKGNAIASIFPKIWVAICTILLIFLFSSESHSSSSLPPPNPHPLPPTLAQWETVAEAGDYFSEVETTPLGYLIWSEFPVKVCIDLSASKQREDWEEAVETAIAQWNRYLPLERVRDRAQANVVIVRSRPPINTIRNPETGRMEFSRARTARTRYEFDLKNRKLIHRMIIEISPDQAKIHTLATARHEMGHALGIWGHSPNPEDVLYFSQVRNSPQISDRDVNTLKKIYQQPTRLGWEIVSN